MFRTTLFFVLLLDTIFYTIWLLDISHVTNVYHLYNPTTNTLGPVQVLVPGILFLIAWLALVVLAMRNLQWRIRRDLRRVCKTEQEWALVKHCV
jgi:hypothetical protein